MNTQNRGHYGPLKQEMGASMAVKWLKLIFLSFKTQYSTKEMKLLYNFSFVICFKRFFTTRPTFS